MRGILRAAATSLLVFASLVPAASGLTQTRFVIAPDKKTDGTHFRTLKAALTTSGLSPGQVIQIEQGSFPGSIADANVDAAQVDAGGTLTIRGTGDIGTLNAISVTDALSLTNSDLHLENLRINIVAGIIQMQPGADRTKIKDCKIVSTTNIGSSNGVIEVFATQAKISGTTIDSQAGALGSHLILVAPVANAANAITGNTLVSTSANSQNLIGYNNAGAITSTNDRIIGNKLLGGSGNVSLITIGTNVKDVRIETNTISDADNDQTAVTLLPSAQNISLKGDAIKLTGVSGTVGVLVQGGSSGLTSATLDGNSIKTKGNGTGIRFLPGSGGTFTGLVQNNQLNKNAIGVLIESGTGGPVSGVDLGGGPSSSAGHNDFTGFTTAASSSAGAIVTSAVTAVGPIFAHHNTFSVPDPETVIFDGDDIGTFADVEP